MFQDISRKSTAITRSICAENPKGTKGGGARAIVKEGDKHHPSRELGQGWKVRPSLALSPNETTVLAEIDGPGQITHLWMTCYPENWRRLILRMYWDNEEHPSVEVPLGDFFCNGWGERSNVTSLMVGVNPAGGFNCYWKMPFFEHATITIENLSEDVETFFFQIDYELCDIPKDSLYFHAFWNRSNPLPYGEEYVIVDDIQGEGNYVGTYMAWGVNNNGWWGEGEVKFFMDGDTTFPTICGTGTEDYFGGAWNFEQIKGEYSTYSNLYSGLHQAILPDGLYSANTRFGMYRWHLGDPVRFSHDLKVTMQALGWRSRGRFLPRQDDISSVAFWYQTHPHTVLRPLPNKNYLEVI